MQFDNKTLVIFDLDGTLLDSAPDLALAINLMLTDLGFEAAPEPVIRSWVGNGAQTLVSRALQYCGCDSSQDSSHFNDALVIFLAHYQAHLTTHSVLYNGVFDTLMQLKQSGLQLALVTNKPMRFIDPILSDFKLRDVFSITLGGDSLAVKKPHPEPLLHTCEQLGTSVEQAVMVGDSKNDILAAKAANMQSVGLTYGYNYNEAISLQSPDVVLDEFSHLLQCF
ncbi:phosphoglycolate phosphatase [Pseudoalteromonas ulvae UL12]|uniref:phosphoglycolate phosphatase n=1 Tax=Pseudoalteromonas ulvae TaxID=107327 RepID=UPI00186B890D|nr:phosphoglycolate phosphatase [Pseudoalteromonas ulvae]MBE0365276.1 phosphoglycolate phosphatase [Pseudoalteromonas ulvae UL12]